MRKSADKGYNKVDSNNAVKDRTRRDLVLPLDR